MEVTAQGDGSLEYVKDTRASAKDEDIEIHNLQDRPEWCKCSVCREMPTLEENKCCGLKKCVTSYRMFKKYCLYIKARSDVQADDWNFNSNSYRKAAYRQFILWKYGKLGKGNRKVTPSCVVLMVRLQYPSRDGVYMGYKKR